jgi:CubicO group peptidase (beta-lactamase class C family)
MGNLGLGAGPPQPAGPPDPDEWIGRLGTLPLQFQPGARWLYNTGADVLGVLVARAAGQPFETVLRERIFDPLGMRDTGFSTPSDQRDRLGPCFSADETGARTVFDPSEGQWSTPPRFPAGGSGLVSTVSDYLAFAEMLAHGGQAPGTPRVLSRATVEAMTTDQLTAEQRRTGPDPAGAQGWGFGVSVQVARTGPAPGIGTYGWSGGLGSTWANDPTERVTGILLTNQMWTSPVPPAAFADFWTCVYTSLAG